ncbi:MAG: hypothetical protein ACTSYE_09285 [Alphaproteobacteria bacterium]
MTNKNIDLDRKLFPLALSVMRRNWLPCGIAAVLLLASNVGGGYLHATLAFPVLRSLIIMIVGYSIYRVLLSGGRVAGVRAMATDEGRIPWRYAGVMLMILTPILVLGIVWTAPGSGVGPSSIPEIVFGVVMVVAYASAYVLLGTALPEVAERGDVALGEAIERGRANYRAIAMPLVFGPWIFRAATVATLISANLLGVTVDLFDINTGAFQPAALGPMLLFTSGHIFAEVLTAIVLVRAYRRYPAEAPRGAVTA